jgi:hypothetical protein
MTINKQKLDTFIMGAKGPFLHDVQFHLAKLSFVTVTHLFKYHKIFFIFNGTFSFHRILFSQTLPVIIALHIVLTVKIPF